MYNEFLDKFIPLLHQLQQEMNTQQVDRINYIPNKVTEKKLLPTHCVLSNCRCPIQRVD